MRSRCNNVTSHATPFSRAPPTHTRTLKTWQAHTWWKYTENCGSFSLCYRDRVFHSSDVWASFVQFRWMTRIIYHSPYVRQFFFWQEVDAGKLWALEKGSICWPVESFVNVNSLSGNKNRQVHCALERNIPTMWHVHPFCDIFSCLCWPLKFFFFTQLSIHLLMLIQDTRDW